MAAVVTTTPPGSSQTVADGGAVAVPAEGGALYQIRALGPDGRPGPVLDPLDLEIAIEGADLIVTIDDGSSVTFEGLATLLGDAGRNGGLADASGVPVIASLEQALAAAAGPADGGGGDSPTGGGSIEAAFPFDDDGFGGAFDGAPRSALGLPVGPSLGLPEADPNLTSLNAFDPPNGAAGPTIPPVVAQDDESLVTNDIAVRAAPVMFDLLDNDSGPPGLRIVEVDPASVALDLPASFQETGRQENPLGPGEILSLDISLLDFNTFLDGTFNLTVLEDGKMTVSVAEGVPLNPMTDGDALLVAFDYRLDGRGGADTATATVTIDGINGDPFTTDVHILLFEGPPDSTGFALGTSLPFDDFEELNPFGTLSVSFDDVSALPSEAGITPIFGPSILISPNGPMADGTTLTGMTEFTVSNPDGGATTRMLSVEIRDVTNSQPLIGHDDPDAVDILIDNGLAPGGRDSLLMGLAGDDRLFGELGNDTLFGGAGVDDLSGGPGDDTLEGDDGDDRLEGGSGNDLLLGELGDDGVFGGDGNDLLFGGEGDDVLGGGGDSDSLTGGAGRDRFSLPVAIGGTPPDPTVFDVEVLLDFDPSEDLLSFGSFFFLGNFAPTLADVDALIAAGPGAITVGDLGLGDPGTDDVSVAFTSFTDLSAAFPGSVEALLF